MRSAFIVLLCLLLSPVAFSQVLPAEGASLNFRLIGFSFPAGKNKGNYKLEVARGKHTSAATFGADIVATFTSTKNELMGEVPAFGEEYTWKVTYPGTPVKESPLYHFSTAANDRVDTNKNRLRVLQPSERYNDRYITTDGGGVFYDTKGKPVAYLKEVNGLGGYVIGMDITKDGTITFNYGKGAYEINLNGDILWRAPTINPVSGDPNGDAYHHELVKLPNGHYMVLGMEYAMTKRIQGMDTSYVLISRDKASVADGYHMAQYGTIIEFDKQGNVVWSWKDTEHLIASDFKYFNSPVDSNYKYDPHSNSFFFDEKKQAVYLSYRNINRVIKIGYPSGKILEVYGEHFRPGATSQGAGLFCNPHGVRRSAEGYLYFYNNNSCFNTDSIPSLVMFKEADEKGPVSKVWEYVCKIEPGYSKRFGSGGNVHELEDGTLFACMGNEYSKIFIVTRDKKETWSALPERFIETDAKWIGNRQYRANIIHREDLERLVWVAERAAVPVKR